MADLLHTALNPRIRDDMSPGDVLLEEAAPRPIASRQPSTLRRMGRTVPRILESRVGTLGLAIVALLGRRRGRWPR